MKKIILAILALPILFASCDDDDAKFDKSLLEGKWEVIEIKDDDVVREYLDDCTRDNIWTFGADGKITNYNPCLIENAALVTANWKIDGDILHVDGAVSFSATSQILELTADKMVLLRPFGSYSTITETYRKNDAKQLVDYAQEASGTFSGLAYYADYEITESNLPTTSVPASMVINKLVSGVASVEYKDFNFYGQIGTLMCEKVPVTRSWGVTLLQLPNTVAPLNITRFDTITEADVVYDMILQQTSLANGVDSVYTSIWSRVKGQNEYTEFYFFKGERVK